MIFPYKWSSKELQAAIGKIPGPETVPILGNMLSINVPSTGQSDLQFIGIENFFSIVIYILQCC